jgi:prolipoprotein diacylglyceryltransferase
MDKAVRPEVKVFGKRISGYFCFVVTGLIHALILAGLLTYLSGTSYLVTIGIIFINVILLLAFAMLTKVVWGFEQYTFYHYLAMVLFCTPFLLRVIGQPVFPYLDIIAHALMMNLAVGRVGCFIVGCCHGKPCTWGVLYGKKHVHSGFTSFYLGIRLFPLQLLEHLLVISIIAAGVWIFLYQPAGNAVTWLVISYGLIRYLLEYYRGDAGRPFLKGFSEAQWTSIGLMLIIVAVEFMGLVPFHSWHLMATVATVLSLIIVAGVRRFRPAPVHSIFNPNHIMELSELITSLSDEMHTMHNPSQAAAKPGKVQVGCTSLGIQVSLGVLNTANDFIHHYSFSSKEKLMNSQTANALADLITRVWYPSSRHELIDSKKGVYHLVINKSHQHLNVQNNKR